jgi:hypothetical protein
MARQQEKFLEQAPPKRKRRLLGCSPFPHVEVKKMIAKVLRDLPFNQHQPLKLADD